MAEAGMLDFARDAIVLFMVVGSPLMLVGLAVGDYWINRSRRSAEGEGV
jgi:hypothetical protein